MSDPLLTAPESQVITFYSYKGGVGRSLLTASVGVLLARWGYRVLCVDWDLEAPGLGTYLNRVGSDATSDGLVQFFGDITEGRTPRWRDYVQQLDDDAGLLHLITAGNAFGDYFDQVQSLDFAMLYKHGLGNLVEDLRESWQATYDFVLIDSRTGVTDIGGICTVQLPDVLVICFAANEQSFSGALEVARRAIERRNELPTGRGRPLVLPLLTRLETSEYDLMQEWIRRTTARSAEVARDWLPKGTTFEDVAPFLRIAYIPRWSFGEGLPVLEEDGNDPQSMSYSLSTIAALLAHSLSDADLLVANRQLYVETAARDRTKHTAEGVPNDLLLIFGESESDLAHSLAQDLRTNSFAVELLQLDGLDRLRDALPRARHLALIVGTNSRELTDTDVRQLVLDVLASETERLLIPVLVAPTEDALPVPLRSFRVIQGWNQPATAIVAQVSKMLRPSAPIAQTTYRQDRLGPLRRTEALGRFDTLVRQHGLQDRYAHGYWTATYEVLTATQPMALQQLREGLMASVGRETGWPVWWWPHTADVRPRIVENAIECLLAEGTFSDPSHSDYWRATPDAVLFLLRGYEDDGQRRFEPGSVLDFTLPIWRTGECLLHASRFAANIGARNVPVSFQMTWGGLRGRRLATWANERYWGPDRAATEEDVVQSPTIEVPANQIADELPTLVSRVLEPLYVVFDFFQVPRETVEKELAEMRNRRSA